VPGPKREKGVIWKHKQSSGSPGAEPVAPGGLRSPPAACPTTLLFFSDFLSCNHLLIAVQGLWFSILTLCVCIGERWECPLEAVREAPVNAICHRDYLRAADIQVRLHDDRLEIWNPGAWLYRSPRPTLNVIMIRPDETRESQ